ncbi:MAG: GNAT family N-acetyltransferase, partial [Angustibacter sp.]
RKQSESRIPSSPIRVLAPQRGPGGDACGLGGKLAHMTRSQQWAVQPISAEALPEIRDLDQAAFMVPEDPDEDLGFFEWDRCFGVRDTGQLIGFNASFSLSYTAPGGGFGAATRSIPMAGLSWVAVHPGYRRQGVLTSMMHQHVCHLYENGLEPLSGLHPSEAQIYGRFGYGAATSAWQVELARGTEISPDPGFDSGDIKITFSRASPQIHTNIVDQLYTEFCRSTPGAVHRTSALTHLELYDTPQALSRMEPLRLFMAHHDERAVGYLLFRRSCTWADSTPTASTEVIEVAALTAAASYRLWQSVLSLDLTARTSVPRLGTGDPLVSWLTDLRAAHPVRRDKLWLRIVDLARALGARRYGVPIDLVLEVVDDFCPWNAGRWEVQGDERTALCSRTRRPPDLTIRIADLAAVFAGEVALSALAAAGLVKCSNRELLLRTSMAFRAAGGLATSYVF